SGSGDLPGADDTAGLRSDARREGHGPSPRAARTPARGSNRRSRGGGRGTLKGRSDSIESNLRDLIEARIESYRAFYEGADRLEDACQGTVLRRVVRRYVLAVKGVSIAMRFA